MKNILVLILVVIGFTAFATVEPPVNPPAPQYEMYGFLKESSGFRQALKGVADDVVQQLINPINPATTDPSELARLKLAKAILQETTACKAFSFVVSELFTATYCTNLNDFGQTKGEFETALNARFVNLAERWALN